ncbi:hypothetical protein QBC46DRAFT_272052 [Diplogelasinospora grovesii]|uniref:Uncharacterized protein n=1 Tax=Diplogelasinospora grovesii TaxID=303347 RepID=A0AAN6MXI0_9PEZI|nr:hypothetical protein QBC46DRAFT_272052 [Diplogelasinospora grovesii]
MGAAISRCTCRAKQATPAVLTDINQQILERQPNWLVTPSRWRQSRSSARSVRYRTPTPYPKTGRRPLEAPAAAVVHDLTKENEEMVEMCLDIADLEPLSRQSATVSTPPVSIPPPAVTAIHPSHVTWEGPSRRNRFERDA